MPVEELSAAFRAACALRGIDLERGATEYQACNAKSALQRRRYWQDREREGTTPDWWHRLKNANSRLPRDKSAEKVKARCYYGAPKNSLESIALERIQRAMWMHWRVRRYGRACLTRREYDALVASADLRRESDHSAGSDNQSQRAIAKRLGITQPRVSQLLANADRAMLYFDETGVDARWITVGAFLRLVAPVETER